MPAVSLRSDVQRVVARSARLSSGFDGIPVAGGGILSGIPLLASGGHGRGRFRPSETEPPPISSVQPSDADDRDCLVRVRRFLEAAT